MLTKLVFISLLSLSKCWPFTNNFDPDADFCEDPDFSGGVVGEDGETYLFKGEYYWRTRPLTRDTGILGYATPINRKWPEVNGSIRSVFTVAKDENLITIFVVKNNWFGYQKGKKTMDGTVDEWPDYKKLKVTSVFTPRFGGHLVYVLHSDNNFYALYDFTNVSKPKKVISGPTTIRSKYLIFTEEGGNTMPGKTIRSLINLRAGLTYREKSFLLSKNSFCAINLVAESYERECNTQNVNELLNCPLDLSRRPTPKMTTVTTVTTTKKPNTTISPTTIITTETTTKKTPETSSKTSSVAAPIPSNWQSISEPDSYLPIRTGIPILGREFDEEEYSESTATLQVGAGVEALLPEKVRQNSEFWIIAFMVAVICISVIAILIAGVVSRVQYKKRGLKGEEISIE